jgi:hypothetical protein
MRPVGLAKQCLMAVGMLMWFHKMLIGVIFMENILAAVVAHPIVFHVIPPAVVAMAADAKNIQKG